MPHTPDRTLPLPPRSSLPPPPPVSSLPASPDPPGAGHRRWLRGLHVAGLAIAIPAGLFLGLEAAGAIIALFVLVVPFEKMFRRHPYKLRRPGLRTDLTYALVNPVLEVVGLTIGVAIAVVAVPLWLPALALQPLVTAQPGWLQAIEAALLLDILIYWTHRLGHEVPLFWRFHSIHHSSQRMDWISGIRTHPFDGVIIAVPVVMLLAAGFQLEVVGVFAVIQFVIGLFAHANVRWRLRPLHPVVMTPEFHHWHHSNHPEAHCSNYSVFLPIWDILWKSYYMPSDRRPQIYGISQPVPPSVPGQLVHPFRGIRPWLRHPF
ncbi:MAG: sterol desaturase family protein, partial [Acidimicrobiia bacterium]|nr:sterol desaturase family protein [Acidimicrobiia bacterium]